MNKFYIVLGCLLLMSCSLKNTNDIEADTMNINWYLIEQERQQAFKECLDYFRDDDKITIKTIRRTCECEANDIAQEKETEQMGLKGDSDLMEDMTPVEIKGFMEGKKVGRRMTCLFISNRQGLVENDQ